MRKIRLVVAAGLVAAAVPGVAPAAPGGRTETKDYVAGGVDETAPEGPHGVVVQGVVGGVTFDVGAEKFVRVTVSDKSGAPVRASVVTGDESVAICGATTAAIPVRGDVSVYLFNGKCGSGNSFVTTGSITATFGGRR